jgi:hypothetical protein
MISSIKIQEPTSRSRETLLRGFRALDLRSIAPRVAQRRQTPFELGLPHRIQGTIYLLLRETMFKAIQLSLRRHRIHSTTWKAHLAICRRYKQILTVGHNLLIDTADDGRIHPQLATTSLSSMLLIYADLNRLKTGALPALQTTRQPCQDQDQI